ncbi:MAG: malate/lactate/ureidoglycolate dehydrogenase [Methylobacteriaceae bacterium]|nr:malate/lactate/ureidoglycolate dehydrogenase [Methylobacteriaceae bacterium]MBV9703251.1 malate/lactate/ureidoglycolate dehydrogenase [Methylobacteriaceae bacterium]
MSKPRQQQMQMQRIKHDELVRMAVEIFAAAGSDAREAECVAQHLVEANLAGHDSHGVVRINRYLGWLRAGQVVPNRHAEILLDRGASLLIDGGFGYGQVIGAEAMDLLAARTAAHGFAVTALRNSGHLGRIGAWAEHLAKAGYVSVHFVNSSGLGILVAPHGGSDRRLSANPIAAGAPVAGGPPLILDMATSVIAEGKIALARNKKEQLPAGYILDGAGRPTTDPETFYAEPRGAILPFGGHKGSGLSVFCEILAGSLTGGFSSHPGNPTAKRLVNNMLSLAFDPAAFAGTGFLHADIERLIAWTKASPPIEPGGSVLLPGEIEQRVRQDRLANGIPIDPETWAQIRAAAAAIGVAVPQHPGAAS